MRLAFTFVDLITVAIVAVSVVFAVWRGFISETLSIVAWAAAAFAALYFGPYVAPLAAHMFSPLWLAYLAAYAAVFLVVLIPISFASFRLSETVKSSAIGPLDRALGAAFGVARELVVVGGLYLLFSMFVPLRSHPQSLREARLLPLIQSSAEVLIALAPTRDRVAAMEHMHDIPARNAAEAQKVTQSRAAVPISHAPAKKVYGAQDRRALDRLIQSTGDGGKKKP